MAILNSVKTLRDQQLVISYLSPDEMFVVSGADPVVRWNNNADVDFSRNNPYFLRVYK
jgi:hypothetical protein